MCCDLGENQKALEYLTEALPLFRAVEDASGEGKTLSDVGEVYFVLGERQKALSYYNQALPSSGRGRWRRRRFEPSTILAGFTKLWVKSKKRWTITVRPYSSGGRWGITPVKRMTLGNIGVVYEDLGERQKALDYYHQALPVVRAAGDRYSEAVTLNNNLGEIYYESG